MKLSAVLKDHFKCKSVQICILKLFLRISLQSVRQVERYKSKIGYIIVGRIIYKRARGNKEPMATFSAV
jgi:hypothetical protein